MKTEIHVWHLEITDAALVPPAPAERDYQLNRLDDITPELARFLYVSVGSPWTWYMRLPWTYKEWHHRVTNPEVAFWMASLDGHPIGYFEMERRAGTDVEICFFGLLPQYIGKGLGRTFLEDAIFHAWQFGGKRVWLHTCSLDHPQALSNYQSRGFRLFKEEDVVDDIPDQPLQPWQGANR